MSVWEELGLPAYCANGEEDRSRYFMSVWEELGFPAYCANGEEDDVGGDSGELIDPDMVLVWDDEESGGELVRNDDERDDVQYAIHNEFDQDILFHDNHFVKLAYNPALEKDSDFSPSEEDPGPSPHEEYSLACKGSELLTTMWELSKKEGLTDFEIEFKGGETLRTSRLILAYVSVYFKTMLCTPMRETREGRIKLQTTSLRTFNYILAYGVGQPQKLQSREDVYDVLEQADMMQMQELTHKCLQLLTQTLSPANALETYFAIAPYECAKEKKCVLEYIHRHIRSISKLEDFINLTAVQLWCVLDTDFEALFYDDVLKAVVKWVDANSAEPWCVWLVLGKVLTFSNKMRVETIFRQVVDNPNVWENEGEGVRPMVTRKLMPKGSVCLLALGGSMGAGQSQSPLHAWRERDQKWVIPQGVDVVGCLPSLHSSFASDDFNMYVTGGEVCGQPRASTWITSRIWAPKGMECGGDLDLPSRPSIEATDLFCKKCHRLNRVDFLGAFRGASAPSRRCKCLLFPSEMTWVQRQLYLGLPLGSARPLGPVRREPVVRRAANLNVPRMQHGSAVVNKQLFVAGGLPGPLSSVEKLTCTPRWCRWDVVGHLPKAVCRCTAGGVGSSLLVVGYPTEVCEEQIIQTFNTETGCGQVITLDVGPCGYLLPVRSPRSLHCLCADGSFLELVEGPQGAVEVKCATQLQDFQVPAPFRAFFDGVDLLVFDISCSPVKMEMYSPDGEKKIPDGPFLKIPRWSDVVGLAWAFIDNEEYD